jgi:hypothetical protein
MTGDVAVRLERALGIPARVWTRAEAEYQASRPTVSPPIGREMLDPVPAFPGSIGNYLGGEADSGYRAIREIRCTTI